MSLLFLFIMFPSQKWQNHHERLQKSNMLVFLSGPDTVQVLSIKTRGSMYKTDVASVKHEAGVEVPQDLIFFVTSGFKNSKRAMAKTWGLW